MCGDLHSMTRPFSDTLKSGTKYTKPIDKSAADGYSSCRHMCCILKQHWLRAEANYKSVYGVCMYAISVLSLNAKTLHKYHKNSDSGNNSLCARVIVPACMLFASAFERVRAFVTPRYLFKHTMVCFY